MRVQERCIGPIDQGWNVFMLFSHPGTRICCVCPPHPALALPIKCLSLCRQRLFLIQTLGSCWERHLSLLLLHVMETIAPTGLNGNWCFSSREDEITPPKPTPLHLCISMVAGYEINYQPNLYPPPLQKDAEGKDRTVFDIPIFTEEFLNHSKGKELKGLHWSVFQHIPSPLVH